VLESLRAPTFSFVSLYEEVKGASPQNPIDIQNPILYIGLKNQEFLINRLAAKWSFYVVSK
jgi:hypothetical protein